MSDKLIKDVQKIIARLLKIKKNLPSGLCILEKTRKFTMTTLPIFPDSANSTDGREAF